MSDYYGECPDCGGVLFLVTDHDGIDYVYCSDCDYEED